MLLCIRPCFSANYINSYNPVLVGSVMPFFDTVKSRISSRVKENRTLEFSSRESAMTKFPGKKRWNDEQLGKKKRVWVGRGSDVVKIAFRWNFSTAWRKRTDQQTVRLTDRQSDLWNTMTNAWFYGQENDFIVCFRLYCFSFQLRLFLFIAILAFSCLFFPFHSFLSIVGLFVALISEFGLFESFSLFIQPFPSICCLWVYFSFFLVRDYLLFWCPKRER